MAVCLGKVIGPTCGEDAMKIIDNLMRVMRAVEVAKQCPYDIEKNNEGGGAWRSMLFIRLGYCLQLYRLLFKMNGADSEPWRQLPTTVARENCCSATQVTSVLCRRWRPSRNRIVLRSKLGYQFLTDFDSHNRCLVYALGDPMDHCCVHFAFVFTL